MHRSFGPKSKSSVRMPQTFGRTNLSLINSLEICKIIHSSHTTSVVLSTSSCSPFFNQAFHYRTTWLCWRCSHILETHFFFPHLLERFLLSFQTQLKGHIFLDLSWTSQSWILISAFQFCGHLCIVIISLGACILFWNVSSLRAKYWVTSHSLLHG